MPSGYVKNIEDEIFFEFARLISKSAKGAIDDFYVFDRFQALKSGEITLAGQMAEWAEDLPEACAFCGSADNLQDERLIPKSREGTDAPENTVKACASCVKDRADRGIYEWLGPKKKDGLHRLIAGKYLLALHKLHKEKWTLAIPVKELDVLCKDCQNPGACQTNQSVGDMTCLCLESVL